MTYYTKRLYQIKAKILLAIVQFDNICNKHCCDFNYSHSVDELEDCVSGLVVKDVNYPEYVKKALNLMYFEGKEKPFMDYFNLQEKHCCYGYLRFDLKDDKFIDEINDILLRQLRHRVSQLRTWHHLEEE